VTKLVSRLLCHTELLILFALQTLKSTYGVDFLRYY